MAGGALKFFSWPLSPLLTCTFLHPYPTSNLAFVALPTPIVSLLLTYPSVSCFVFHLMVHAIYV